MGNNMTDMGGPSRKLTGRDFGRRAPVAAANGLAPAGAGRVPETLDGRSLERLLSNHLLNALPAEVFERLLPHLEPVSLNAREQLDGSPDARYVYFPEDAVVSHLVVFEDGNTVETAMTGREGLFGLATVFGLHAPTHWPRVTLQGTALRLRADLCRQEFAASEAFRQLLLGCAGRHLAQVSQRAACINRHRIESRLAVWLLMLDDRNSSDGLPLTQELIARRIGARRAGVSEVFSTFQERGYVAHSRGLVRIADRQGLESGACECYALLRDN
jgi:CRP-like cAMP-binding protein